MQVKYNNVSSDIVYCIDMFKYSIIPIVVQSANKRFKWSWQRTSVHMAREIDWTIWLSLLPLFKM